MVLPALNKIIMGALLVFGLAAIVSGGFMAGKHWKNNTETAMAQASCPAGSVPNVDLSSFGSVSELSSYLSTGGSGFGNASSIFSSLGNMGGGLSDISGIISSGQRTLDSLLRTINSGGADMQSLSGVFSNLSRLGGRVSDLTGDFGGLGNFFTAVGSFGGNTGGLSGILGQIANMGGDWQSVRGGNFNQILGQLGNLSGGQMSSITGIFGQLGSMPGGDWQSIIGDFGGLTGQSGGFSGLLGQLGGSGTNLSNIQTLLGQYSGQNGASLTGLIESFGGGSANGGNLAQAIEAFSKTTAGTDGTLGLDDVVGPVLPPTDNADPCAGPNPPIPCANADPVATDPTADAAEQALAQVRGPWVKTLDTEPTPPGVPGDCSIEEITVDDPGSAGTGTAGQFVPVHEVGELLALGQYEAARLQTIDQMLQESRAVQQEICVHLKAIRRIQYEIEEKEFVDDPNGRKANFVANAEHIKAVSSQFAEGRSISPASAGASGGGEQKVAAIVENQNRNTLNEIANAEAAFYEVYKNSDNVFKNAALNQIINDGSVSRNKSTMLPADINALVDNPTTLEASDWWDKTIAFTKIENNPLGAYTLAREARSAAIATADQNARDEYLISQGFLGIRECAEWASPEQTACLVWKTLTPGSIIKDTMSANLGSAQRQVEQGDESMEDCMKKELQNMLSAIFNIKTLGQTSIADGADPCPPPPEPGPAPDSGWTPGATTPGGDGGDDGNPVTPDDELPGDNNPPADDNPSDNPNPPGDNDPGDDTTPGGDPTPDGTPRDGNGDGDYNDNGDDADGDGTANEQEPQVWLAANTAEARNNTAITWTSRNADVCQADNYWLSKGTTTDTVIVLKKPGDVLPLNSGSAPAVALHPINLGVTFYQNETNVNNNTSLINFNTGLAGLIQTATVTPPVTVAAGNSFALVFKTALNPYISRSIGTSGTDRSTIINALDSGIAVDNSPISSIISAGVQTNQLELSPVPTYKIKCTKVINGRVNTATSEKTLR